MRARLARPFAAIPLAAAAQVSLALLGWSIVAGHPCGSSDDRTAWVLAAWVLPAVAAGALAFVGLRARPLVVLAGLVLGLALTFATFLGIVFPACG